MADTYRILPVVRFCGVIGRQAENRRWAIDRLRKSWGDVLLSSGPLPFDAGGYYRETMGEPLFQELVAFGHSTPPDGLADWKVETNELEREAADQRLDDVPRPINLDCGYVTQAKFMLATTKDRSHRIYLRRSMFAEITLTYIGGSWRHHEYTYPNYRTPAVAEFATQCRIELRRWIFKT